MYTVSEVAKLLQVSTAWVYRHKHALGGFQLQNGGALRFPQNCIEIQRKDGYAVPNANGKMARYEDDMRTRQNIELYDKGGSQKMGSRTKSKRMVESRESDPFGLLA